ncbi:trehalose-phosphatase [Chromohalobacter israelensis]|uniref:Trehalose 6-phosphate phosphatase n=1 Tax=Chromohalobacter israelensis (strain ATCC BAA-138 / DSM 3043 / CIP 106854 / NCIMB 13768 / 1H11) TaxID=290398 RepID=Q1R108_CHRI1|nr:trehalose-phosphatase [Chromohalobacter salexigens]ABE57600.1 trehalose 6-phosphatase [Chromohalobacter salexigens DSM 3043]
MMPETPPPLPRHDWALFLDFDGTLVPLADHPRDTSVSEALRHLVARLAHELDGAVAIISGRPVADLEALLAPLDLPLAGVHGLEWRDTSGGYHSAVAHPERLAACRDALADFVAGHDGLHYEDKRVALALHYRGAPELAAECRHFMAEWQQALGDDVETVAGKCVIELRPAGVHKGTAIARLLDDPVFQGRRPVFVGDDVTDEDAFREVNARGGLSVRVGDGKTAATYYLESVKKVLTWLEHLPSRPT